MILRLGFFRFFFFAIRHQELFCKIIVDARHKTAMVWKLWEEIPGPALHTPQSIDGIGTVRRLEMGRVIPRHVSFPALPSTA